MTYEALRDPYGTGDYNYKIYELVEGADDSEELLRYMMAEDFDSMPESIPYYPVDGDEGELYFDVFPKDILGEEDLAKFEAYIREYHNEV